MAELLDHPSTDTPLTIAITGPWGSGKTSLARMVEERLHRWPRERGTAAHITCWFNAWLHDDAPNLGAAFAAEVARVAEGNRSPLVRLIQPLPTRMLSVPGRLRRRTLWALLVLPPLLLGLLALQWDAVDVSNPVVRIARGLEYEQAFGLTAALAVLIGLWSQLAPVATSAARFVTDPAGEAARGSLSHVRRQLGDLIHQATHRAGAQRRFVVFVDDLERCEPARAVEVCEKAHQLFGHRDVAVVLLADMAPLAAAAAAKHEMQDEGYGERFLQKLVQVQFDLPTVTPATMRGWLAAGSDGSPDERSSRVDAYPDVDHTGTRPRQQHRR